RNPTAVELHQFFLAHRARYHAPESLRFVHVFAASRERAVALRSSVLAWSAGAAAEAVPPMGDALPVSRSVVARLPEVVALYGDGSATRVRQLPVGTWSAPIVPKRGWHLVRVLAHEVDRPASFEEARESLTLDWLISRREEAVQRYLRSALARWHVDVDGE